MTASTNPKAAATPAGSQLAAGAILTRVCRKFSFQIAEGVPSHRLGNTAAPELNSSPARALHPLRSFDRQTLNQFSDVCSERDPIPVRVRNDADLRAGRTDRLPPVRSAPRLLLVGLALLGRHPIRPSFSTPTT